MISGCGFLFELDWVGLVWLDVGCWYSLVFVVEFLLCFEQIVVFCQFNGCVLNIEIKFCFGEEVCIGMVVVCEVVWFWVGVLLFFFSSFKFDVLVVVCDVEFVLFCVLLLDEFWDGWLQVVEVFGVVVVVMNWWLMDVVLICYLYEQGWWVVVYMVNDDVVVCCLIVDGIDGFIIDVVDWFGCG